jgi:hypothetical protein
MRYDKPNHHASPVKYIISQGQHKEGRDWKKRSGFWFYGKGFAVAASGFFRPGLPTPPGLG